MSKLDDLIVEIADKFGVPEDGVANFEVYHDDSCSFFDTKECDCKPDISIKIDGRFVQVVLNGEIKGH
jgi:hypothetical protein